MKDSRKNRFEIDESEVALPMYGKTLRMGHIISRESKKMCIVPLDHGTTLGPIGGISNYLDTIRSIINGGADAIVVHKGLLKNIAACPDVARGNYIMHMSVSTILSEDPSHKVLVATVEEAVKLGAVGVSLHVNLESAYETEMIKDFGKVSNACLDWGMPLLAMSYACKSGKNVKNITHAARLAEELGADIIKVDYPGSSEGVKEVVSCVQAPVIIAGGSKCEKTEEILDIIHCSVTAGASGVAIGRNIFQSKHPKLTTECIVGLINGEISLHECKYRLGEFKERPA